MSLHFITQPGYGIWSDFDTEIPRVMTSTNNGNAKSKYLGDGIWCPNCYASGVYNWIHTNWPCSRCKRTWTYDDPRVIELMELR